MTNAELTKLAITSFNRIPRVAIPDVVGYDIVSRLYEARYADGSCICFTDNQLGPGVLHLTDLDFIPLAICDKIGRGEQRVFVYTKAIKAFVDGLPYSLVFLRQGKVLRTKSTIPELFFSLN